MREAEPMWYYVGNGQLRYKNDDGWTDQYQDIDEVLPPRPTGSESPDPPVAKASPAVREPRRRRSIAIAACVGLLGLGVADEKLNTDVLHGLSSWATVQVRQISALTSPAPPPGRPAKASVRASPPPAARRPANLRHPSRSDCLKFRDQLRVSSTFQNAHRRAGSAKRLPASRDVLYLSAVCGLTY